MKLKMKKTWDKVKRIAVGSMVTVGMLMSKVSVAYADDKDTDSGTGISQIDFGIGKLIGLFTALVSAYGLILLIKSGVEFFSALHDRDAGTMKQAGLGMLAGFGTASIGGVITFLGFTW